MKQKKETPLDSGVNPPRLKLTARRKEKENVFFRFFIWKSGLC